MTIKKTYRNNWIRTGQILEICEEPSIISSITRQSNIAHYDLVTILKPLLEKDYLKKILEERKTPYKSRFHRKRKEDVHKKIYIVKYNTTPAGKIIMNKINILKELLDG